MLGMQTAQAHVETAQFALSISRDFAECKQSLPGGCRKGFHGTFQQTLLPGPSLSCGGPGIGRTQAAVVLQAP